jgi:hypothetical protein
MAKKETTPEERKAYLEQQHERGYGGNRMLPVDMSFIDRKGNIVRPNKKDYETAIGKRDRYNAQTKYNEAIILNKKYDSLISKYGKDSKEVYKFEKKQLGMHKGSSKGLAGKLATITVLGFVGSIFFLSNNMTGNVIGSLNKTSSNWIGVGLLAIGLICGFFLVNNEK